MPKTTDNINTIKGSHLMGLYKNSSSSQIDIEEKIEMISCKYITYMIKYI